MDFKALPSGVSPCQLLTTAAKAQGPTQLCTVARAGSQGDAGNLSELSIPVKETKTQAFPAGLLESCHQLLTLVHFKTIKKACWVPGEAPAGPVLEKQEMMKAFHQ